jgi:hypothetical protein
MHALAQGRSVHPVGFTGLTGAGAHAQGRSVGRAGAHAQGRFAERMQGRVDKRHWDWKLRRGQDRGLWRL